MKIAIWVGSAAMLFTSTHELTLDPKNRLSIPSAIRSGMDAETQGTKFYIAPSAWRNSVSLFGDRYFEQIIARDHGSLKSGPAKLKFQTAFYAASTPLEMDKQGRVCIPQRVIDRCGLERDVVLSGAGDHLILWKKEAYEAFMADNEAQVMDVLWDAQSKSDSAG